MAHVLVAASAALIGLIVYPSAPLAEADTDQTIRVQNGQVRCLLSADFEGRGRPAAVCARADGAPFSTSPARMNLAVVQGSGELYYLKGALPGPDDGDAVLGAGETYRVNGWTIETEELRTLITYDVGRHGIRVNPVEVAVIWK
ncbi:hypothetical protein [Mycolicibacterium sp. D5.8-2]|uniref:hypothetical protein n=1 Tax=Mycolicibacterium sp. D5.8-2 TaxID=3085903 RepID=UPI00298D53D2|nr:hypothetical protein [Mycolicibacterium sp. D5.8-2]MDW5610151.1 hypothetical protein [Mycolicibacterium sp. D5.8-2]